jgi:BASS family bile acid:Na+ symporter
MLLAASPGGSTANLFSYLFKGDIALNITLTAINSVIAAVYPPPDCQSLPFSIL